MWGLSTFLESERAPFAPDHAPDCTNMANAQQPKTRATDFLRGADAGGEVLAKGFVKRERVRIPLGRTREETAVQSKRAIDLAPPLDVARSSATMAGT